MEKEKLYELGKKGFEKELGYIPDIEKCKYYTVKDSCDEIVTKFIRDEYGNAVDDYQVEETFEWVVEERLEYTESNIKLTPNGRKEEKYTVTIIYDDCGRLKVNVCEELIQHLRYYDEWFIESEDK